MSNESLKEKNDKRLYEYAKAILEEILVKNYVQFPDFVTITKEQETYFYLSVWTESGAATIVYSPHMGIEALFKSYILAKFPDKEEEFLSNGFSDDYFTIDIIAKVRGATIVLLKNFPWEFKEVVEVQPKLADRALTLGKSKALTFKSTKQKGNLTKIVNEIDKLILEFATERKKRFLAEFEARVNLLKTPEEKFAIVYDRIHKKWDKAKKYYNKNKTDKSLLTKVKIAFPDLDEDLIERFSSPDDYISMPSKIALFHTARELRMPEASASQTLENILTNSRKVLGSLNIDEIEDEEGSYAFFDLDSMQEVDLAKILIERFNKSISED